MITTHKDNRGQLIAIDLTKLPFTPVRAFVVNSVPAGEKRGDHAHKKTTQYILCIRGQVTARIHYASGKVAIWELREGDGIGIHPMEWSSQTYASNSELLVFCDQPYDEGDYIRDWGEFVELSKSRGK